MFVVAIGWYDSHRFLQLGPWRQLFQVCLRKYVDSGSRVIAKLQYLVDCSRGDVEVCLLAALYTKLVTPSDSSSSLRWCTFLFGLCLYLAGGSGWSVCWGAGPTAHMLAENGRQRKSYSTSCMCCSGSCMQDSSDGHQGVAMCHQSYDIFVEVGLGAGDALFQCWRN